MVKRLFTLFLALFPLLPCSAAAEEVRVFSIGSGSVSGNYFPVARAICNVFNARDDSRRRCSPEPTPGSVYNLTMMRTGELDFAIAQSDWQKAAFDGTAVFAQQGPMSDLRVVLPLFSEAVTILAAPGSGIETIQDLRGKSVDIGRSASGRNATIRKFLQEFDLELDFFGSTYELEPKNALDELCEARIDASIFVLGHPNEQIGSVLAKCGLTLVQVVGPSVSSFLENNPVYQNAMIDLDPYGFPGQKVQTVSVIAALITRGEVENSLVADLAEAIKMEAAKLTAELPVLEPEMIRGTSSSGGEIPNHPGVLSNRN